MKKVSLFVGIAAVAVGISATSCDSKKNVSLKKDIDSASYALGLVNGDGFRQMMESWPVTLSEFDIDILIAAFEQGLKNDSSNYKMDPMEANSYFQTFMTTAQNKLSDANLQEGEKFLEENKTKDGVITTESGLQYKVITEGTGTKPTANDRVKVHYTGTLLDGTVFDSSVERGEPATFGVGQVIRGWTEGLQIMPVGSKYIFWIPSELAYGERGAGGDIKPNSTLKFEVELLEIVE